MESVTAKHNSRRGGKRMIAAVDIGGTKIAVGMVDSKGHLVSRAELPTAADAGYSSALNRIVLRSWITASTLCSRSRGPWIAPDFVTCPTNIVVMPLAWQRRLNS